MQKKKLQNIFRFKDKGIWKNSNKFPILRREHLSSAVSVLLNSPKILHITQRDFFNLSCLHRDQ